LVHIDWGLSYMGLASDQQRMGYVLRTGERAAPPGLERALQRAVEAQQILARAARPGRSNVDVVNQTVAQSKQGGIEVTVYAHAIGTHGHGLGAAVDFRLGAVPTTSPYVKPLRAGSYLSVELNTASAVDEWNGQRVYMMLEDGAELTESGYRFFA